MDIATTRLNWPKGPICRKNLSLKEQAILTLTGPAMGAATDTTYLFTRLESLAWSK